MPSTIVRLAPETASRWVRPVVANSSRVRSERPDSSPATSAGTSAAAWSSRWSTPSRTPSRTASLHRHHHGPAPTTRQSSIRSTAASSLPSAGSSPARTTNRVPATKRSEPSTKAVARTRTRHVRPRDSTTRTVTGTTRSRPAAPAKTRPSSRTCTSARTVASRPASSVSGEEPTAATRHPHVAATSTRTARGERQHGSAPPPHEDRAREDGDDERRCHRRSSQAGRSRPGRERRPGRRAGQTETRSRRSARVASPMPFTSSRSSTERNGPFSLAPRDDRLGRDRADAGEGVELHEGRPS